jgi:hypothetical protein
MKETETIFDDEPETSKPNPLKKATPIDLNKFEEVEPEVLEHEEDQGQ